MRARRFPSSQTSIKYECPDDDTISAQHRGLLAKELFGLRFRLEVELRGPVPLRAHIPADEIETVLADAILQVAPDQLSSHVELEPSVPASLYLDGDPQALRLLVSRQVGRRVDMNVSALAGRIAQRATDHDLSVDHNLAIAKRSIQVSHDIVGQ